MLAFGGRSRVKAPSRLWKIRERFRLVLKSAKFQRCTPKIQQAARRPYGTQCQRKVALCGPHSTPSENYSGPLISAWVRLGPSRATFLIRRSTRIYRKRGESAGKIAGTPIPVADGCLQVGLGCATADWQKKDRSHHGRDDPGRFAAENSRNHYPLNLSAHTGPRRSDSLTFLKALTVDHFVVWLAA